eukprot:scaffold266423_cov33-Tisochrysis_lutea.AAC.3
MADPLNRNGDDDGRVGAAIGRLRVVVAPIGDHSLKGRVVGAQPTVVKAPREDRGLEMRRSVAGRKTTEETCNSSADCAREIRELDRIY